MNEPAKAPNFSDPGVRNYTGVCFCALLAVLMGLVQRGQGWSALFPVVLGMLTLVVRWRIGPLLVLAALGMLLLGPLVLSFGRVPPQVNPQMGDLVVCLGVLAYVAGHYRLQGLVGNIFPVENKVPAAPRRGQRGPTALRPQPRSSRVATGAELVLLLASLPAWVGLALVLFPRLLPGDYALGIRDRLGRLADSAFGELSSVLWSRWPRRPGGAGF